MNDCQSGIGHRHLPPQLSSLFPVQTTTFQPLKSGHPAFRHGLLLKSEFRPGLGSACEETTDSPARPGRPFSRHWPATNQCIAAAGVMLLNGHKAPTVHRPLLAARVLSRLKARGDADSS